MMARESLGKSTSYETAYAFFLALTTSYVREAFCNRNFLVLLLGAVAPLVSSSILSTDLTSTA